MRARVLLCCVCLFCALSTRTRARICQYTRCLCASHSLAGDAHKPHANSCICVEGIIIITIIIRANNNSGSSRLKIEKCISSRRSRSFFFVCSTSRSEAGRRRTMRRDATWSDERCAEQFEWNKQMYVEIAKQMSYLSSAYVSPNFCNISNPICILITKEVLNIVTLLTFLLLPHVRRVSSLTWFILILWKSPFVILFSLRTNKLAKADLTLAIRVDSQPKLSHNF